MLDHRIEQFLPKCSPVPLVVNAKPQYGFVPDIPEEVKSGTSWSPSVKWAQVGGFDIKTLLVIRILIMYNKWHFDLKTMNISQAWIRGINIMYPVLKPFASLDNTFKINARVITLVHVKVWCVLTNIIMNSKSYVKWVSCMSGFLCVWELEQVTFYGVEQVGEMKL